MTSSSLTSCATLDSSAPPLFASVIVDAAIDTVAPQREPLLGADMSERLLHADTRSPGLEVQQGRVAPSLEPRDERRRPVCILSMDGGGIKGHVLALVLDEIERACGLPINRLFDLIGGVSTGGVAALHAAYADPLAFDCFTEYLSLIHI